jgi:hypothetical protein
MMDVSLVSDSVVVLVVWMVLIGSIQIVGSMCQVSIKVIGDLYLHKYDKRVRCAYVTKAVSWVAYWAVH